MVWLYEGKAKFLYEYQFTKCSLVFLYNQSRV
nr:MAG TPA: hypothetical protein [Caudoviricetes sp.]